MDEESVSVHELLFSCYKDDLKLFTLYYLNNNIINRKMDAVFLIHSLIFVSTEKLLKYKGKKIKLIEEIKLNIDD